MKSFTIKQTHIVWVESLRQIYEIVELTDEMEKTHFTYRVQFTSDQSQILGGSAFWAFELKNSLPKATNLFEAEAAMIEALIKGRCESHLSDWVSGRYPEALMKDLGKNNLPLLLNFFEDPYAIKAFEKTLKESV